MIKISFTKRTYIHKLNNSVMIRVRWNKKRNETVFATSVFADPTRWDCALQCAKLNSTHKVGERSFPARVINTRIMECLSVIEEAFNTFALKDIVPTVSDLRGLVEPGLGKSIPDANTDVNNEDKKDDINDIFDEFLKVRSTEANWGEKTHCKYKQMLSHIKSCDSTVKLSTMDKSFLNKLKEWYFKGGYHNATISKHFRNLKAFAKWAKTNGYEVHDDIFTYEHNISVPKKRVVYLTFEELMKVYKHSFAEGEERLSKVRDLFCFMSFTSLRYSDMAALKKSDIHGDYIEIYTEKTKDMLMIPIISYARSIIERYKDSEGELLFSAPSNQKLNDYLKEMGEVVGLDRNVTEVYYVGKKKHATVKKLYETLSCHDARRTFVCCSLRFGITPTVVMACTGHSDYESMQPYIDVSSETTKVEMTEKWETRSMRDEIIRMIETASPSVLQDVFTLLKQHNNDKS